MAKFCKKCGSVINEATGKCPKCDSTATTNNLQQPPSPPTSNISPQRRPAPGNVPPQRRQAPGNVSPQKRQLSKKALKEEKKKQKKQAKKAQKKQKRAQLTTKQKVKRFFVKLIAVVIALSILAGCGTVVLVYFNILNIPYISNVIDKITVKISQEKDAEAIEKAFKDGDVEKINLLIFGENTVKIDSIDFEIALNDGFSEDGLISHILKKTTVTTEKRTDSTITYKISSPNMQGVFDDIMSIQTQEELLNHIISYADSSELIENDITVDYVVIDNELKINYQTTDFINAILGGLISEYNALYQKALDEMR